MDNNSCWHELHAARRDWAFDAHEAFISRVQDPSLTGEGRDRRHVTVAVYGSTQVGKTTLILHLLGVKPDRIEEVADLLRGQASKGSPATATALRYRRSPDGDWHIGRADTQGLEADQAQQHFRDLRQRMLERQDLASPQGHDTLDVFIPNTCFDRTPGVHGELDIHLVDLPGIGATEESERAYARRLAARILPRADIVVLAGSADDLGFLAPVRLELPELEDWWLLPHRFRVVCTKAYSPDDRKQWLKRQTHAPSMAAIRKALAGQFATHDIHHLDDLSPLLYPVEIGQSLRELERDDSVVYERARSASEAFMEALLESVSHAANPWFRFRSAWTLADSARRKLAHVRTEAAREIRDWRKKIEADCRMRDEVNDAIDKAMEKIDALESRIKLITGKARFDPLHVQTSKFFMRVEQDAAPSVERVDELQVYIINVRGTLADAWVQLKTALEDIPPFEIGPAPRILAFHGISKKLDGYRRNSYSSWLGSRFSSWQQDLAMLGSAIDEARKELSRKAAREIQTDLGKQAEGLAMTSARQQKAARRYRLLCSRIVDKIKSDRKKVAERRTQIKADIDTINGYIAHGGRFETHMRKAYNKELRLRRAGIACEPDPAQRLLQSFLLPLIEEELADLRHGVNANE